MGLKAVTTVGGSVGLKGVLSRRLFGFWGYYVG